MRPGVWKRLADTVAAWDAGIREVPVSRPVRWAELRAEIEDRYRFGEPVDLEVLLEDASRLLRDASVQVTHPRYFGLFNPSVREAGIVGDALAALYNPQLAVWSHAPAAQELERVTLRRLGGVLGLDPERTIANFTTGGAEANLSAVLAALARRHPETGRSGLAAASVRPTVYLTSESHHSFVKIARMTGLGTDALREVRITDGLVMDPAALDAHIRRDASEGRDPLLVVATAGSTATGTVDPISEIAEVTRTRGLWLHVDAAWGAAAALVPRLRRVLAGIEQADSVTWDAHKWLSVPMGAGMFFCRHAEAVRRAFAVAADYMPPAEAVGTVDPFATTVQWSRRAIGLKVFLSIAEEGLDGYARIIDRQVRMGDLLRERLEDAGWIVTNRTPLPVVCFTHPEIRERASVAGAVLATLHDRGRVWISDVAPGGRERVLRACITSYRTDESDVACLVEELSRAIGDVSGASRP